ncbi:MAG: biopolymer transporter ExbD [Gemmatimonadota bacterium]|jgi:biopolymer transport protein TolR|nr:biopolymer transporter ExbD [Gemmatimonadota bacterium]
MSLATRRRARGDRADLPMNAEINVTSLVDIAFTLLIIFMITMPIFQGGIEVSVPTADVQPLTSQDSPIIVTILADGTVYLEESVVTVDGLESGLAQLLAVGNIERVVLQVDSLAPWGPAVKVMSIAQNSGVNWSISAVPYRGN